MGWRFARARRESESGSSVKCFFLNCGVDQDSFDSLEVGADACLRRPRYCAVHATDWEARRVRMRTYAHGFKPIVVTLAH